MYKKIMLDNGLRLVVNPMNHMESAAIGIWINSGSRNEEKQESGISHFLEHMLFKGTADRDHRRIKEEIEGKGGSLNGFTSEEITCYLAKVSGKHLDVALDVLSDMVLNASVNKDDVERERTVIMEEIKMYLDMPNHHVHDILSELMWPAHPLGFPIAGRLESVGSISREDIIGYKKANYILQNMVIAICGKVKDVGALAKKVQKIFQFDRTLNNRITNFFGNTQTKPNAKIVYKETEQSHLCIGLHSFGSRHKDRYILALLHIILGANMSSRLFENVRENKGLAYEIGTEIKRFKDTGAFIVHAGMEHKKVKKAINVIIGELRKIKKELIGKDELSRAKEFCKVQLLLALEDTVEHMLWLGDYVTTYNKLPNKEEIIKRINAITIYDIRRVAGDIFNSSNLNLALIGALKDKEGKEIEKELEL